MMNAWLVHVLEKRRKKMKRDEKKEHGMDRNILDSKEVKALIRDRHFKRWA